MALSFTKMHGAANDFVVLEGAPPSDAAQTATLVRALCDRRRGVGADGALWIERLEPPAALRSGAAPVFRMHFYNSDGGRAALCLNGGRCCARRAHDLGWPTGDRFSYLTDIGEIRAEVHGDDVGLWLAPPRLVARDLALPAESPGRLGTAVFTGDPHLVVELDAAAWGQLSLEQHGRLLRHWTGAGAFPEGNNVHFILREPGCWQIRTFERGVEGETWACGSGCFAAVRALGAPSSQSGGALDAEPAEVLLRTRSGSTLGVLPGPDRWRLRGPAVTAFTGVFAAASQHVHV